MQVFVTGATGVLGKAVVKRLIAEGHAVHALSRSEANREKLHSLGAQPMQADLFDGESLKQVLAGCEAVLHLATRIAPTSKMAKRASWEEELAQLPPGPPDRAKFQEIFEKYDQETVEHLNK